MVVQYISKYFIVLFEIFGLFMMIRSSVHVSKSTAWFTRVSLILLLLNTMIIHYEHLTQTYATLSPMRPILTACIYSMQPLILITSMFITSPPKARDWVILLPEALCIPIYFTSQNTHLVCWFAEPNYYHGGRLSWLPYIVFAIYLIVFSIRFVSELKYNRFRDAAIVIAIIAFAALGVVLYMVSEISDDYSIIFTTALVLYYLSHYIRLSRVDALTGLFNRQCMYRDMTTSIKPITAVVSVDMNDLKLLNDTQGHGAGDTALKTVAGCLASNSKIKTIYRIGGDEFIIFYFIRSIDKIKEDIANMRKKLAATPYVCAFGYALVKGSHTIEETISEADMYMYINKAELKKGKAST